MKYSVHSIKRITTTLVLVIATVAVAAPTTQARPVEDYLPSAVQPHTKQTLVEPAPATDSGASSGAVDPDTKLALVEPAPPSVTVTASSPGDAFDWGDAGIGATVVLALGAIGAGILVATGHVSRRPHGVA